MRITRPFVLLALAALLSPRIEASRTSVWESNPPAAVIAKADAASALAPAARLDTSTTVDSDIVDSPRFDLGDVVLVESELEHEERFGLGPLDLLGPTPLRGPPSSYLETRVRGFELLPAFRVGASASLSVWERRACGSFSCGVVSDSPEDPWGLMEEMASYAGMATAGYSQEEILQQAARDRASAAAAGKAQLALIGGVNGAGWLSRTWAAVKETWQIGVGLKVTDWLRVNQYNLARLGEEFLESVNPNPGGSGMSHPERGAIAFGKPTAAERRAAARAAQAKADLLEPGKTPLKEFDIDSLKNFGGDVRVGDPYEAHELLQHAWLKAHGYVGQRRAAGEASRNNPAVALSKPLHDLVYLEQDALGLLDPAKLKAMTAAENIASNAEALRKAGIPEHVIQTLTREAERHAASLPKK